MTKIIDDGLTMFNLGNNYYYKNLEIKKYKDNSYKAGWYMLILNYFFPKRDKILKSHVIVECDSLEELETWIDANKDSLNGVDIVMQLVA